MIGPMEIILILVIGVAVLMVRGGWSPDDTKEDE